MTRSDPDVRDVRDCVRAHVRAQSLLAVGMCGMCGHFGAHVRARMHCRKPQSHRVMRRHTRAYSSPHIPHIPHIPTAASVSGVSVPAQDPAHPARAFARAFFTALLVLKKMEEEAFGNG